MSLLTSELKANSTITSLNLERRFYFFIIWSFFIEHNIGELGASLLSEALKINSSLTSVNLGMSSLLIVVSA